MVRARWIGGSRSWLLILLAMPPVAAAVLGMTGPAAARRTPSDHGATGPRRPLADGRRPPLDLRRELPARAVPGMGARLAGLFSVPLQSFNLTTFPRPPAAGGSTPSQDLDPDWSSDERSILFASNRGNRDGTAAGPRFHLWVASADGAAVTALTGAGSEADRDQLDPAYAPEMGRIAYAGQPAPGAPLQLYVLDLGSGARAQLTGPGAGVGVGASLTDVSRPSWSPGGDRIAFAARSNGARVAGIYLIQPATRAVVAVTRGSEADGIDSVDPAWSPDGRWIAFASTGKRLDPNGGFAAGGSDHDLWLAAPGPPLPGRNFLRLTEGPADDREPAWSPRAANNGAALGNGGQSLLAFASNRAGTYDLWWIAALDPRGTPSPESATVNPARLFLTNDVNPTDGSSLGRSEERAPTWARFRRSANVAYQSNAAGNWDVWQASFLDVVAPALEAVDELAGEIVRVTPRLATPGAPVRIEARVRDLQSGPASVWAQIKDPDGKYQGSEDGEHKLYRSVKRAVGDAPVEVFEEWECEGVSAASASGGSAPGAGDATRYFRYTDFEALKPGANGRPNLPAPSYMPVVDDRIAFSGSDHPPLDGSTEERPAHWLRLWDDGPAPAGHEPPGAIAGDTLFSAEWTTPLNASDYYLDVIAYDGAADPLGRFPGRGNWKLYDNVGGFSTAPFVAAHPVLVVMDHPLGQKFLGGRIVPSGQGTAVSFAFNSLGTESYILDQDERFLPQTAKELSRDRKTVGLGASYNNLGPTSLLGDAYDVWRVLARGPLDPGTLMSYTPVLDRQPEPSNPSESRTQLVAERAVLWAAPFAGDLWVGRGSITDPQTQALLTQFALERGGRLWVTGQDVAWALTQDGSTSNPFLSNVLRAQYAADSPPPAWSNPLRGGFRLIAELAQRPEHPLVHDPLGARGGFFTPATDDLAPDPLSLVDIDSYPSLGSDDAVLPLEGTTSVYTYALLPPGTPLDGRDPRDIGPPGHLAWAEDRPRSRRVIFSSFGLEQVGRSYVAEEDKAFTWNYRGKLTHAALCWLTHFAIQGRVTDTGRQPLAGVVVRAIAQEQDGPRLAGSALTDIDGTYLIRGLPPRSDGYALQASLPGFLFQHAAAASEHGLGRRITRDLIMTRAAR